ncbi:MAG: PEGA domain-containing protein [Deltaproteobacteria bacterium]|nr:PEGA domain-containing protein [Deltaproteobacteria bacterium]MDQ3301643.1 PEGA domain-containing protein [Myxococcota bacterium]
MGGTRIRVAGLVIGLVLGLVGGTPATHAEDEIEMEVPPAEPTVPVKDPAAAKKHVATAKQLVQKGDAATRAKKSDAATASYESAVSLYEQAIEAGGDANLYYDLGLVEEKLGKLASAAVRYRHVIKAEGVRPDVVKRATARFDDVTTKIGLVLLIVKPDGATISIAGKQVGTAPLAEPIALMPGTYTFTLEAEGHAPKESELVVEPGSESERTIELDAAQNPVVPKPADPTEDPVDVPSPTGPSRTPMFVAGGTAVGLIAIGAITGILAVGEHGTFDSADASSAERADARDAGKRYALITDLCIGGAVVAGGIAAYWYFTRYKPAKRKQAPEQASREARRATGSQINAKVDVVPWVKPDAGGFVLAGQF